MGQLVYAKYATIPSLFLGVSVTYELLVISNEILRAVSLQAKALCLLCLGSNRKAWMIMAKET